MGKDGVRALSVHPGVVVGTALNNAAGPDALRAMGLIDERRLWEMSERF